jgi:hypothetical protein
MPKRSPHDLLKRLQELNPGASAAELKQLMWDELQRGPESLRKAVFDDVFDQFVKETGHRPRNVDDTSEEIMKWLKKPSN